MSRHVSARRYPILALVLIVTTAGCAHGIRGGKKYARFAPDAAEHVEPARQSGEHFIVVRMAHEKGLARWPDTKRELRRGDPVGFKRDEDGSLLAVAGNATRSLEPVPVGIAYIAWYHREDRPLHSIAHGVRDGIGHGASEFAEDAGPMLLEATLDAALDVDDDCDEQPDWLKRQRKR